MVIILSMKLVSTVLNQFVISSQNFMAFLEKVDFSSILSKLTLTKQKIRNLSQDVFYKKILVQMNAIRSIDLSLNQLEEGVKYDCNSSTYEEFDLLVLIARMF